MKRTERHTILKSNINYKEIDGLCFLSKNLYNYTNYLIRQEFINNGKFLDSSSINRLLRKVIQNDFINLLDRGCVQQPLKVKLL